MIDVTQLERAMRVSEEMIADTEFGIALIEEAMNFPEITHGSTLGLRILEYIADHGIEPRLAALCGSFYTVGISHYNDHVRKYGESSKKSL